MKSSVARDRLIYPIESHACLDPCLEGGHARQFRLSLDLSHEAQGAPTWP